VGVQTVSARRVGYQPLTRQVTVTAATPVTLDLAITAAPTSLEQLVVTASGESRRREVGAAVSTVDASALQEKTGSKDVSQLLQGNATGVTITQSTGSVGTATNIRVRGNTSINLSNMPLVYVDGARINTNARSLGVGGAASDRFLDISPDDIESIEIVKGPAAATLYGTEAAAGVVRVTTKRGSAARSQTTVVLEGGQRWDANDYPDRAWNPLINLGPGYKDTTYYINNLKGSADMENAGAYFDPFRTGNAYKLSLGTRGGTGTFGYYMGYTTSSEEGVFVTNGQKEHSLRSNLNFEPFKDTRINLSSGYTTSNTAFNYGDGESWGFVGAAILGPPMWSPINASDPTTGGPRMVTCPRALEEARRNGTPLADETAATCVYDRTFQGSNNFDRLSTMDVQQRLERFTGSATAIHTLGSLLSTRVTAGYDSYTERGFNMVPNIPLKILDSDPNRTVTDALARSFTLEGSSTLTYDLPMQLQSQTTVGAQWYQTQNSVTIASSIGFPPGTGTVGNGAQRNADEEFTDVRTVGYYVQEQLAWRDRLYITPAVRFDRNSAFGPNLGTIAYPKISASWVVNEESWFPKRVINGLRLRGALGTSGKQPGPFDALTVLSTTPVALPDGSSQIGFSPQSLGNRDLKPERGQELELGFDAQLFSSRLRLEFTAFDKKTRDALVLRPLPPSTGFAAGRWDNVGEVVNKGIEVGVDADVLQSGFMTWNSRLTYTGVSSKITRLAEPIAIGGRGLQEHREGNEYGAYFMRPVSLDADGNIVIAPEAVNVGHPTPDYEGSLSNTMTFLGDKLSLFTQFAYSGGNKMIDYTEVYQCRTAFGTCAARYDRDASGNLTRIGKLKSDPAANFQPYMFLYDASFVRLRTVSLTYILPPRLASAISASSANVSVIGSNFALWTDYPGTDPEVNSQGRQNASARDFLSLGQPRSFTISLRLTY
jgi:TonB-linked SusC/RagA family outer membrane protein